MPILEILEFVRVKIIEYANQINQLKTKIYNTDDKIFKLCDAYNNFADLDNIGKYILNRLKINTENKIKKYSTFINIHANYCFENEEYSSIIESRNIELTEIIKVLKSFKSIEQILISFSVNYYYFINCEIYYYKLLFIFVNLLL